MAVDWLKIKTEYINGGISYRKLAEKHGVSFAVLKDKAVKERWADAREHHANKIRTSTEQKTVEKVSEALSDEAAAKVRIRASMMRLAEGWFKTQEEWVEKGEDRVVDPGDFRKMVQSCVDLGVMDVQEPDEHDGDGLIEALSANAQSLFDDGDDSGMLPAEEGESE